jgi:hypothetical protein
LQIKKFLAGKFEDERIAQVKKTTNWNISVGDQLRKMLVADPEFVEDWKGDVQNRLKP